jgi:NAD(P)-dependent dehydrogenase (short-subunit alcohol dehydrogenase family)
VAVITGGGRGIGRAISLAFAREGARVVLAARSLGPLEEVADAIRRGGGEALVVQTDVSDQAHVVRMVETAVQACGQIDILVNNAGVAGPAMPLVDVPLDEWESTFASNVRSIFLACKAVLPVMIEAGGGKVINIGSMSGKRPLLNRAAYCASKMAVVGLTRTLAWEVGPHNIRVNCISPGPVEGERIEWVVAKQAEAKGLSLEAARRELEAASPLGRFTQAEEVAAAAIFLASDRAGAITGEDLNVSAGVCMY